MTTEPPATVTAISITPVKGLHVESRETVELGPVGVAENRAFFLVDDQHRLINNKHVEALMEVHGRLSPDRDVLSLHFPDGHEVSDDVRSGPPIETRFFSESHTGAAVSPTLSAALSEFAGRALTLVRADPSLSANDRGPDATVSLMSRGSLQHLGGLAGEPVDGRRFRMLFEVDGLTAHAEDAYVGRQVRIGDALVDFRGHIGRCRVTQMDPDSGETTLPTLKLLGYRRDLPTTEKLAFGIYGAVIEPGRVRIGDPVTPV